MQLFKQETLQMIVVADDDLQQIVVLAGQEMTFEHFPHPLDPSWETLDRVRPMMGEHHVNEAEQIQPDGLASDDRRVAVNDPAFLELV